MTYWVWVGDAAFGTAILSATFPGYAEANYGNGWYIVGVGPNQNFHASAAGYYNSGTVNTDAVDPNSYYFYFWLQRVPPPPPPPPPPGGGGGWA